MTHQYQFTLEGVGINPHYESRDFYFITYLLESVAKTFYKYDLTAYHLQQDHMSWIVSDILVEYYGKPLKWRDVIDVKMGFRHTKGLRIYCDFEVYHKKTKIAQATMLWVVIDEVKRRPKIYPAVEERLPLYNNPPYKDFKFQRIEDLQLPTVQEQDIRYSVIDFNHHLNAYQYFRFSYDALPSTFVDQHYPLKFQAKFEHEIMLGEIAKMSYTLDNLSSYHKITCLKNGQESTSFKLKVEWNKRS